MNILQSSRAQGMSELRILHVLPWVASGGVERRRLELAARLPKDAFVQRVVCLSARPSMLLEYQRHGVTVDEIGGSGGPLDLRSVARVVRIARRFRPQIIHGAVFEGVGLAALAGRLGRVPHTIIEEIACGFERSWRGHALFRAYASLADELVAVSHAVADYLSTQGGIDRTRITVIRNGISKPEAPSATELVEARARWGIAPGDFVVGSVGRMNDTVKRFSDLIHAVAAVRERAPGLRLLLVGEGHDRSALEQLARNNGIAERVTFTGYLGNPGLALACMDVCALVSSTESFGLAAAEAMHWELPVIASAVGGLPELVTDGQTGVLVPMGDRLAISAAILRLHGDADLRRAMGARGAERAAREFGAERYVREVEALYRRVAGERRAPD